MDIPLFHYYPFDYLTPLQSSITELLKFLLTSFSHFSLFSHIVLPACGCGRRPALLRPEQPRPPRLQQQVPQSCPNRRGAMSAWPRLDTAGTAGSSLQRQVTLHHNSHCTDRLLASQNKNKLQIFLPKIVDQIQSLLYKGWYLKQQTMNICMQQSSFDRFIEGRPRVECLEQSTTSQVSPNFPLYL